MFPLRARRWYRTMSSALCRQQHWQLVRAMLVYPFPLGLFDCMPMSRALMPSPDDDIAAVPLFRRSLTLQRYLCFVRAAGLYRGGVQHLSTLRPEGLSIANQVSSLVSDFILAFFATFPICDITSCTEQRHFTRTGWCTASFKYYHLAAVPHRVGQ